MNVIDRLANRGEIFALQFFIAMLCVCALAVIGSLSILLGRLKFARRF